MPHDLEWTQSTQKETAVHPEGMPACSRWSSEAIPPEIWDKHHIPEGWQQEHETSLAPLPGCVGDDMSSGGISRYAPSTTGHMLSSVRDEIHNAVPLTDWAAMWKSPSAPRDVPRPVAARWDPARRRDGRFPGCLPARCSRGRGGDRGSRLSENR